MTEKVHGSRFSSALFPRYKRLEFTLIRVFSLFVFLIIFIIIMWLGPIRNPEPFEGYIFRGRDLRRYDIRAAGYGEHHEY